MGKLKEAVESGDKREILLALRDVTASTIEETKSGRDVAALTKRLIEITEAIDALPDPDADANPVDALAAAIAEYDEDEEEDEYGEEDG